MTGEEAMRKLAGCDPDVLLLDLEMPGVDGIETLRRLKECNARARTIVFTVFDTDERIVSAMKAGAKGYLLKGAPMRGAVSRRARGQRRRIAARTHGRVQVAGKRQQPGCVDVSAEGSPETDCIGPVKQGN